jgi:tight adherence protein C
VFLGLEAHFGQLAGPGALPAVGAAVFGLVFLGVLFVVQAIQSRSAVKSRATAADRGGTRARPNGLASGRSSIRSRQNYDVEEASELLFAVEKDLSTTSEKRLSKIRKDLIRAGYFAHNAVAYYYATRILSACIVAYLVSVAARSMLPDIAPTHLVGLVGMGAALGLLAPALYVRRRHNLLYQQCREGFPTFLDLLVVCAEAGLTPRAGIERVSKEITRTHSFLGANLYLMSLELRAGRPLIEAVEGLGRRINLDEVRSFGSLLQQTEELGSNLTSTLRAFSEDMRARRFFRAEEKAYGLPVKLVLPLALFVFPGMLVVALLPIVSRIQKAFF